MSAVPEEFPPRPTALAHSLLGSRLANGDLAIDATAGNGHDTLFLAARVGPSGRVLAFDPQERALTATAERLKAAGLAERVTFHRESHARIADFANSGSVAAVMFNLGYLPGGDHDLTTTTESTLAGLQAALRVIRPCGVLSVVCYPGHAEGAREAEAVVAWFADLTENGWRVARYGAAGTRRPAPFLLVGAAPTAAG